MQGLWRARGSLRFKVEIRVFAQGTKLTRGLIWPVRLTVAAGGTCEMATSLFSPMFARKQALTRPAHTLRTILMVPGISEKSLAVLRSTRACLGGLSESDSKMRLPVFPTLTAREIILNHYMDLWRRCRLVPLRPRV